MNTNENKNSTEVAFKDWELLPEGLSDDAHEPESLFSDEGLDEEDDTAQREDQFRDDVEADADALASAGYGTDEDYGGYNDMGDY